VEGLGRVAQAQKALGDLLRLRLGPGEDHGPIGGGHVKKVGENLKPPPHRGRDRFLLVGDGLVLDDVDEDGVFHVALGKPFRPGGEGGGEEEGLAERGRGGKEGLHLLLKAHGEHLVRLVQDGDLHPGEVQDPLPQVVQGPPGGGHHHVRPPEESLLLLAVPGAPVDGHHLQVGGHGGQLRGHLEGELPGGGEDEGPGLPPPLLAWRKPFGDGEGEGQGLAGARAGLADEVLALQGQGEGRRLDGGGGGEAAPVEGFQDLWLQGKVFKLHALPFRAHLRPKRGVAPVNLTSLVN